MALSQWHEVHSISARTAWTATSPTLRPNCSASYAVKGATSRPPAPSSRRLKSGDVYRKPIRNQPIRFSWSGSTDPVQLIRPKISVYDKKLEPPISVSYTPKKVHKCSWRHSFLRLYLSAVPPLKIPWTYKKTSVPPIEIWTFVSFGRTQTQDWLWSQRPSLRTFFRSFIE